MHKLAPSKNERKPPKMLGAPKGVWGPYTRGLVPPWDDKPPQNDPPTTSLAFPKRDRLPPECQRTASFLSAQMTTVERRSVPENLLTRKVAELDPKSV